MTRQLDNDPYVRRVLDLAADRSLYELRPQQLRECRTVLLRECLDYFLRRRPDYYAMRLHNLGITACRAELTDLVRLAIPSQLLHSDLWRQIAVRQATQGATLFQSSGTTGGVWLTIGRSKLDDEVTKRAIPHYLDYVMDRPLAGGALLMLANEAMVKTRILFRDPALYFGARGTQVVLAMRDAPDGAGLEFDPAALDSFLASQATPKFIFASPIGVQRLLQSWQAPPIDLGLGGAVFTGGGGKGGDVLPLRELRRMGRDRFLAKDESGDLIPAPWFDGLGHTEGLLICLSKPNQEERVPHPLEEVFLVDDTFELIEQGTGFAGHWNPLNTSYLEAFYPGDFYSAVPDQGYYGRAFVYVSRAVLDRSGAVRPGCGALMEDSGSQPAGSLEADDR